MRTPIDDLCGRHTLVTITFEGRERIFAELVALGYDKNTCIELLLPEQYQGKSVPRCPGCVGHPPIPGIVRREEMAPRKGYIPVGFVSWRFSKAGRLRIPSFVHPDEIESIWPPGSAMARAARMDKKDLRQTPPIRAVAKLLDMRKNIPAQIGLWGTAALEVQTGYPYTHALSDLDILFSLNQPAGETELQLCLGAMLALEKEFDIRVDAELTLPSGFGVSLKEFLSEGQVVLAKGPHSVTLLHKKNIRLELAQNPG